MAVSISNQVENHRGIYFEVTGDGVTTALTVNHSRSVHAGTTAKATVTTAPTGSFERKSGSGGFVYPAGGTAVAVSSVSVTSPNKGDSSGSLTVNTSVAVGNGTKAYVAVVFDQYSVVG